MGVKNVSDAVKAVPDSVLNTVDGVVDGLYRRIVKSNQPRIVPPNAPEFAHRGSIDLEVSLPNAIITFRDKFVTLSKFILKVL